MLLALLDGTDVWNSDDVAITQTKLASAKYTGKRCKMRRARFVARMELLLPRSPLNAVVEPNCVNYRKASRPAREVPRPLHV